MSWFNIESPLFGGLAGVLNQLFKLKLTLWIGRALSGLGLGFAAQEFLYEPLIDQAVNAWQAVPAVAANWVHALGLDTGISILLSCYGVKGVSRVFMSRTYQPPL